MQDNQLITISNPFQPFNRECLPVPFTPGRTVADIVAMSGMGDSVIVLRNGMPVENLRQTLLPGDVVHIYPRLHDDTEKTVGMIGLSVLAAYAVGPAVSGLVGGGVLGTAAGGLATVATITAGGMLINGGLSAGGPKPATYEDSPTYHWDIATNPTEEGLAIPVGYGEYASYPTIINQWIDVVGGEQWGHTTLCVGEGLTNNLPTADDIYAGDQKLSLYDSDDYALVTTDGGPAPDWTDGANFTVLHQMRKIDRQMKQSIISGVLLHCNGTNGSTTITDDAEGETNVWTCQATAALATGQQFLGTACLDVDTSGGYVSCDNEDAFDIWTSENWTVEFRWRQDTITDSGIIGQSRIVGGGGDDYYWAIVYNDSTNVISFRQFIMAGGAAHTDYYNAAYSWTPSNDTWYHICFMKYGAEIYAYIDGTSLGTATVVTTTPVAPPAGTWAQAVGMTICRIGGSVSTWYGECLLDEIRIVNQAAVYNIAMPSGAAFTAPTTELADTASETYKYTSAGVLDNFAVIITAPYGIYWANSDGSLDPHYVQFWISYRQVGATSWTRQNNLFYGTSRGAYRMRFTVTGLTRGQYEISIGRGTADHTDTRAQTTTLISYIDEYLDIDLTYPYLQCIGISLKAQDDFNGTIPAFRVISQRDSITVPSYDGDTTQTVDPTTNAYAAFDALTNTVYGAGVSATKVIEADWESWATYCTTTVGGYQRCQFNMIFDAVSTLDDAMQHIEGCGRTRIVRRGTQISCNIDQPSSAVALFGMGNIAPSSDHVRWLRQAERADATEVSYRDKDMDYTTQTAFAPSSGYHALTRVPRVVRINLPGINNKEQATREALLRQQIDSSIKKALEIQSGLEAIPLTSGDVLNYQMSINSFSGRLMRDLSRNEEYTDTTIYLDQEINLPTATYSGNCILMVRDPDDTIQTYTVAGPFDTDAWYVTISASATVNFLAPFIICRSTGDVYQYKATNIERSGQLDVKINALQYDSTAYYNSAYGGGAVAI